MLVAGFGTYDTGPHPRAGILLDGLRAHGDAVLEINAPLGLDTAARVRMLRRPWLVPLLALRLLARWAVLVARVRAARRAAPQPEVVLVGYLGHFDVLLARRLFPHALVALDHLISAADTAADRGVGGRARTALLARLDAAAVGAADVIVADTAEHADLLPEARRQAAVVVPVGAPRAWFAARGLPGPEDRAGLSVVFFGLYTPLQGAPTVGAALGLLADEPAIRVTMIGAGQDLAAAKAAAGGNPNVRWLDWVPPADLPALVRRAHVCLGIFGTSAKAGRVVPNKVFQGAAAGCALVTADTPPQRRLLGTAARFVPPGDPAALAATLRQLASDPGAVRDLRTAAAGLADRSFRPEAVVEPLRDRLAARHQVGAS